MRLALWMGGVGGSRRIEGIRGVKTEGWGEGEGTLLFPFPFLRLLHRLLRYYCSVSYRIL